MPTFVGLGAQDPAAADKLARIQRDLDETKIILHKTIESVLDRGEKLDQVGGRAVSVCCWLGQGLALLTIPWPHLRGRRKRPGTGPVMAGLPGCQGPESATPPAPLPAR